MYWSSFSNHKIVHPEIGHVAYYFNISLNFSLNYVIKLSLYLPLFPLFKGFKKKNKVSSGKEHLKPRYSEYQHYRPESWRSHSQSSCKHEKHHPFAVNVDACNLQSQDSGGYVHKVSFWGAEESNQISKWLQSGMNTVKNEDYLAIWRYHLWVLLWGPGRLWAVLETGIHAGGGAMHQWQGDYLLRAASVLLTNSTVSPHSGSSHVKCELNDFPIFF